MPVNHAYELAWCAGFFDGEGCFSINFQKKDRYLFGGTHQIHMSASQTVKEPLDIMASLLGGAVCKASRPTKTNYKPVWKWSVSSADGIRSAILLIQPYLIVKRYQAEIMLAMCDLYGRGSSKVTAENFQARQRICDEMLSTR